MSAVDPSTLLPQTQQAVETLLQDPWSALRSVHPVEGGILVIIGLAMLLYGFRIYKALVIITYAMVGVYLGALLAGALHFNPLIGMIGGAIVLGVAAWPLYLIGWGMLGGAVFAGLAAAATSALTPSTAYMIVAAVAAGVLGIVLTVLIMRPLIIIITAIIGGVVLVEGLLVMALLLPSFGEPVVKSLQDHPYAQAAVVAIPAILGLILQFTEKGGQGGGKKGGKPKKEAEGE
jgi:hypothetical protein